MKQVFDRASKKGKRIITKVIEAFVPTIMPATATQIPMRNARLDAN